MKKLQSKLSGMVFPSFKTVAISCGQIIITCAAFGSLLWGVKLLTEFLLKG